MTINMYLKLMYCWIAFPGEVENMRLIRKKFSIIAVEVLRIVRKRPNLKCLHIWLVTVIQDFISQEGLLV